MFCSGADSSEGLVNEEASKRMMSGRLTEQEAAQRIRQFEQENELFRIKVDGVSAWRLLRFWVSMQLIIRPEGEKAASDGKKRLLRGLREMPRYFFPKRARFLMDTSSSMRIEKESALYKDVFFDDLVLSLGDCFKLERVNSEVFHVFNKQALVKSDLTATPLELLTGFLNRITLRRPEIETIARQLSEPIQHDLGLALTAAQISRELHYFYWGRRVYRRLLKKIRPQAVLISNTNEFAMLAAARDLGIRSFEMQHGIFSRYHPDALPAETKPYKDTLLVPDKVLLFGDYWREELAANGFYDDELLPVGSVRMDAYRRQRTAIRTTDGPLQVVFTTQGLAVSEAAAYLHDFVTLAGKAGMNLALTIKLHPVYDPSPEPYRQILGEDERVRILLGTEMPSTFTLLSQADLHLSIASACHYDALGLGVPTVVVPLSGYTVVENLIESGHAPAARTPQELVEMLMDIKDIAVPSAVQEMYFKFGALENIRQAVTKER